MIFILYAPNVERIRKGKKRKEKALVSWDAHENHQVTRWSVEEIKLKTFEQHLEKKVAMESDFARKCNFVTLKYDLVSLASVSNTIYALLFTIPGICGLR